MVTTIAAILIGLVVAMRLALRDVHPHVRAAWLLGPVCPILGWGPLTHCYFNYRAGKAFRESGHPADHPVARLFADPRNARGYVQHSVDPDVIKTYSYLNKELHYEYAHNPLPNRYAGRPRFGHALWQGARTDDERLMALGWISHQVVDQFAHNLPFERFFGYVNREAYFGYHWDEVMAHLGMVHHEGLGGAFFTADHWVTELIIDAYCYAALGEEFEAAFVLRRRPMPYGLLERTSRDYLAEHGEAVARDYADPAAPIKGRRLPRCREFADLVNAGTWHYVVALIDDIGAKQFQSLVLADPKFRHLQTVLDLVVAQVGKVLAEPDALYQPVRIDAARVRLPHQSPEAVEQGPLTEDEPSYWSQGIYAAYRAHKPRKRGSLYWGLKFAPLATLRWLMATYPITAQRGAFARACLPKTMNNLGLAMRYAYRLRKGNWTTLPTAMEEVLTEQGLLGPQVGSRLRTF
ncbi:MAG: hypothetical protein ABI743_09990 [bacterium]